MAKILITSALPYINGVKHLGNLVGSMLPADVYARFMRMNDDNEVLFICATDEHGTPAELGAAALNQSVKEFCDEQHLIQKEIYEKFKLSFDHFGRTSRSQNIELTQHFAEKLKNNGYITEQAIKQIYSIDDKRFLPDRYVEGTCPFCGYEKARGDQCENCTKVLDPTDLLNPRSAVSGSTNLEIRETKHLFLKVSALEPKIKEWVAKKLDWPNVVTGIANKWLKEGLHDRCITRDLQWGVPIPFKGFEGKVFYVWFDAPIGYISATKEWSDINPKERDYKDWWFNDNQNVKYVQFMAKDNIPFHTVFFPGTIIGTGEKWKMVDYIKGFNWLTFYGGKFSTSQKRGVFTDQALSEFESDYWRYYLMANAPETDDSSFTFESFASTINKDLNDKLGNFVNRVLKMTASKFDLEVPSGGEYSVDEEKIINTLQEKINTYYKYMSEMEFRKATAELRDIWAEGNEYITKAEPWSVIKADKDKAAAILRLSINIIRIFAHLMAPIIPDAAEKIFKMLNLKEIPHLIKDVKVEIEKVKAKHKLSQIELLFNKIEDEKVEELIKKYGGN